MVVTDEVQTLAAFAVVSSVRLWTVTFHLVLGVDDARAVVSTRRVVAVTSIVGAHTAHEASFTEAAEAVYFVDACSAILARMAGAFVDVCLAVAT